MLRHFAVLILFFLSVILSPRAQALNEASQTVTLDGVLFQKGTTKPLQDASVLLKVQILNPAGTCLLYEETQTVNTSTTKGYFNIAVGSALSNVKRSVNDPGNLMARVFQNVAAIPANNVPGQTCAGSSYVPTAGDVRYFRITVTPSATNLADTLAPDILMDSVPQALVAQSVQGLERANILAANTSPGISLDQNNLESLFTGSAWSNLQSILTGNFLRTDTSGATLPSYAATPAGVSIGDMWYDSTTNEIKYQTNSGTQTVGSSGSVSGNSITSGTISGSTGINSSGNLITSGSISGANVNAGVVTGTTLTGSNVQATNLRVYNGAQYVQLTAQAMSASINLALPTSVGVSGQVLSTDGTGIMNWINAPGIAGTVSIGQGGTAATSFSASRIIASNMTGSALESFSCSLNQVISFDVTGAAQCSNVTSLGSFILNGGNSTGAAISIGTNDNQPFRIKTNNTVAISISQDGTVSVGNGVLDMTAIKFNLGSSNSVGTNSNPIVMGTGNWADYGSLSIGKSNNTGAASGAVALGRSNSPGSDSGIAVGITNTVSSFRGIAVGANNSAGLDAIAIGVSNSASGNGALVFGAGITNSIANSLMIGPNNASKITVTAGGNVGIGTSSPSSALQLKDTTASSSYTALTLTTSGGTDYAKLGYATWGGQIAVTNGASNLSWLSANSAGAPAIGTNVSGWGSKGAGATTMYGAAIGVQVPMAVGSENGLFFNNITGGSEPGSGVTGYVGPSGGAWNQLGLRFLTNDGSTGLKNRMTIDHTGNVGIGTTSPNSALDISGALTARGMSSAPSVSPANQGRIYFDYATNKFRVSENGGAYTDLVTATSSFVNGGNAFNGTAALGTTDNHALRFITNNTTAMTISQNGNVSLAGNLTVQGAVIDANTTYSNRVSMGVGNSAAGYNNVVAIGVGNSVGYQNSVAIGRGNAAGMTDTSLVVGITNNAGADNNVTMGRGNTGSWNGVTVGIGINNNVASGMQFGASDASKATLNSSGFLGLLNSDPSSTLDISGAFTARGMSSAPSVSPANQGRIYFDYATNKFRVSENGGAYINLVSSTSAFMNGGNSFASSASLGTNDNFPLFIKTNDSIAMTISNNSNIGIGTTTPQSKLELITGNGLTTAATGLFKMKYGSCSAGDSTGMTFGVECTGPTGQIVGAKILHVRTGGNSQGDLAFYTNPTGAGGDSTVERLRIKDNGNIGVGVSSPSAKLEVAGEIKVGNSASTCNASTEGQFRYNSTEKLMEFCNGTDWKLMVATVAAASDQTPDAFTFTDLTDQSLGALVLSNTLNITGVNGPTLVSVSGSGSPQISINGGGWVTAGTINSGQTLRIRQLTPNAVTSSYVAAVTVGDTTDNWSVTTRAGQLRMFLTSGVYSGNLGGIAGADAICQSEAGVKGYSGTWKAIVSTSTSNAKDRLTIVYPVVNAAATSTIIESTNLWAGALETSLASGQSYVVWTGSNTLGDYDSAGACSDWTSNSGGVNARMGTTFWTGTTFLNYQNQACSGAYYLYCIEQ